MTRKEFLKSTEEEIKDYICDRYIVNREALEVIQVKYCKTIQNHNGFFIVRNVVTNGTYPYFIECTYNGDSREMYFAFYS